MFEISKPIVKKIYAESKFPSSNKKCSMCVHEDSFYYLSEELWYFNSNDYKWRKIFPIPFNGREGQSMTPTPHGLVFFGGFQNDVFYNDLWIFYKNDWIYVTCDVSPRAFHAAEWDERGYLIITGGKNSEKTLNDFYLIDLNTQETKKLEISNFMALSSHSVNSLGHGKFVIFGKKEVETHFELHTLDLINQKLEKINTAFNIIENSCFCTSIVYGMLSVFESGMKKVCFFDFQKNLWFPFIFTCLDGFPIYIFSSFTFSYSEHRSLFIIDMNLNKIIEYPIFSCPPNGNYKNHYQYICFMEKVIQNSLNFFDSYRTSLSKEIIELQREKITTKNTLIYDIDNEKLLQLSNVNTTFELFSEMQLSKDLVFSLSKLKLVFDSMHVDKKQNKSDDITANQNEKSVQEMISEIKNININSIDENNYYNQELENLSKQIEQLTFEYETSQYYYKSLLSYHKKLNMKSTNNKMKKLIKNIS